MKTKYLPNLFFAAIILAALVIIPPESSASGRTNNALLPSEINALIALYNSTNGPNWTHNEDWITNQDPCYWHGITCGSHTWPQVHVITVNLPNNNLTGTIPPEIVNLTQLDELLLNDNHLTGPLPAGMDNFDWIINLCLQNNQLSGPIPPDLGGISQSPSGRKLLRLFLHNNRFNGNLPPELGNITSLRYLLLNNNLLFGTIPDSFGNLTGLWEIDLSYQFLSGMFPQSLGNLTQLKKFIASDNYFYGEIPAWLGGKPYLEDVRLNNNFLKGPIPNELSASTNLKVLWLGHNNLTGGVPASLAALPNLVSLWISENPLEGKLPDTLTGLNLTSFWYNESKLCEPCDDAFLAWLGTIPDLRRTKPCTPILDAHIRYGMSGSYFSFSGYCYPPNKQLGLSVNNIYEVWFSSDAQGKFSFEVKTDDPPDFFGEFTVKVWEFFPLSAGTTDPRKTCTTELADDPASASATFIVSPLAPYIPSGGNPNIFTIPQGIGFNHWAFIPTTQIAKTLSISFGSTTTPNMLYLMEGGDFDTTLITAGSPPVTARRTGNGQALPSGDNNQVGDYYLQLNADDAELFGAYPTSRLRIEVEYLDQGTDRFLIEYDALSGGPFNDGRFRDSQVITKTGSGQWRTANFLLMEVNFSNRDHGGDFRIDDLGDGYEIIRKVTIFLLSN